jgi:hypothetical protein
MKVFWQHDSQMEGSHAATNQKEGFPTATNREQALFKPAINQKEGFKPRLIRGKVVKIVMLQPL